MDQSKEKPTTDPALIPQSSQEEAKQTEWEELWRQAKINAKKIGSIRVSESGDPKSNDSGVLQFLVSPKNGNESNKKAK